MQLNNNNSKSIEPSSTRDLWHTIYRFHDLWVLIAIFFIAISVFHPVLDTNFVLTDDHEILRFASETTVHPQTEKNETLLGTAITREIGLGRFRPVYYLFRFGLIALLGTNAFAWHRINLAIAIATVWMLYKTLRLLQVGLGLSFLFALLILVARPANMTWINLGPAETTGMLFIALALLTIVHASHQRSSRFWDSIAIGAIICSFLSKESFSLLIPSLIFAKVVLRQKYWQQTWKQVIRDNLFFIIALSLLLIFHLIFISIIGKMIGGYAGNPLSAITKGDSFVTLLKMMKYTFRLYLSWFIPIALFSLSLIIQLRSGITMPIIKPIIEGSIFCLLWTMPQLLLYASKGDLYNHYFFPLVIGIALASILSLIWLWQWKERVAYALATLSIIISIIFFAQQTMNAAYDIRSDGFALNSMLDYLANHVSYGKPIAIAADPANNYEWSLSLTAHIGHRGRADIPIYLLPTLNANYLSPFQEGLANSLLDHFKGHNALKDIDPKNVPAIILLVQQNRIPDTWKNKRDCKSNQVDFSSFIPRFSFKQLKLVTTDEKKTYSILWCD